MKARRTLTTNHQADIHRPNMPNPQMANIPKQVAKTMVYSLLMLSIRLDFCMFSLELSFPRILILVGARAWYSMLNLEQVATINDYLSQKTNQS